MSKGFVSPLKLVQQVESNDPSLTELDLSGNSSYQMKSAEYTKRIGEALKTNTHIKRVTLKNVGIDDVSVIPIAEAIKVNKIVEFIDLEKNKIGSAGAEAIAQALKENTTLTEIVLLGQNKEFGEQCLSAFIDMFQYNVHLLKITWRLNSRQSFTINKCIVRNNEIQKRLKNGTNYDELLPKFVVGLSRSEPVPEHNEPKSGSDQSTTKEPERNEEQQQEEPQQEEQQQEEPQQEEQQNEEPVEEDNQEIGEDN